MRICCISDTHSSWFPSNMQWPDADVLVHAGDITAVGEMKDLYDFHRRIADLPYEHKLVIAGNHDWCFVQEPERAREILTNCIYLQDEELVINGVKFYGSPWQPEFLNWAFNLPRRGKQLQKMWNRIPLDTDVLITHGPPHQILDKTLGGDYAGCEILREVVTRTLRVRAHIFGHIHEGYQNEPLNFGGTQFVNACLCTERYEPLNLPVLVEI